MKIMIINNENATLSDCKRIFHSLKSMMQPISTPSDVRVISSTEGFEGPLCEEIASYGPHFIGIKLSIDEVSNTEALLDYAKSIDASILFKSKHIILFLENSVTEPHLSVNLKLAEKIIVSLKRCAA